MAQPGFVTALTRLREAAGTNHPSPPTHVQADTESVLRLVRQLDDAEEARLERQAEARRRGAEEAKAAALWSKAECPSLHASRLAELRSEPGWVTAHDVVMSLLSVEALAGSTIAIIGDYSTGKTQIGVCAIREACDRHHSARYLTAGQFFAEVDDARNAGGEQRTILMKYSAPRLLVLDELDKPQGTIPRRALVAELLDQRYRNGRDTVLIGNFTEAGFKQEVERSVLERMEERGEIMELKGWSFRLASQQLGGTR